MHAKALVQVIACDICKEVAKSKLNPDRKVKNLIGFHRFNEKLAKQQLQCDPRNRRCAGDKICRVATQQSHPAWIPFSIANKIKKQLFRAVNGCQLCHHGSTESSGWQALWRSIAVHCPWEVDSKDTEEGAQSLCSVWQACPPFVHSVQG